MNSMKPSYFALLLLFASCGQQKEPPATHGPWIKIDLHDYRLPTSDLVQGKVFCYADSAGIYKRFEYDLETISGSDTSFESIEYDSSFSETGDEKDQLSREGCRPVSVVTFQHGKPNSAPVKPGLIPWIHRLQSGDTSFHLSVVINFSAGLANGTINAGFDSVTDLSLLGSYPAKDCIQENTILHVDAIGFSHPTQFDIKEVYCLCRGVGIIGSSEPGGKRLFLKKIISKSDFDAMKGQR